MIVEDERGEDSVVVESRRVGRSLRVLYTAQMAIEAEAERVRDDWRKKSP
jgi:hypothetical protein